MGWHHDWQEHFDIMDFHFCSIIQAEVVYLYLESKGNIKQIAAVCGSAHRTHIDQKLARFRRDNGMQNNVHMVMRLVMRTGFWNELGAFLAENRELLQKAKKRAAKGRQAQIRLRRKKHEQ